MISCVKKRAVLLMLLIPFLTFLVSAKETFCYKIVESSDPQIPVGAIQLISFIGDQCYESKINGVSVKNGTMIKNEYQSNRTKTVYSGSCFCGTGAKFEFNQNRTTLTVTSNKGRIFKLKKIATPAGVTTCSIIKNNNGGGSYNNNYYPPYNSVNNTPNNYNSGQGPTNNSTNQSRQNVSTGQRRCAFCNGTGQITKNDNAPSNFGIERPKERCPTCGEWYNPNVFNHYHITCSHCHGTGIAK